MALIFLLIMTILGVFGMNMSRMENLMAGNNQFQVQALNDSELALREVEDIAFGYTIGRVAGSPNVDMPNDDYYLARRGRCRTRWTGVPSIMPRHRMARSTSSKSSF